MLNKILVDLRLARLEAIKDPKKLVACPECKEQLIGDKFLIHSESHFKLPKKKGSRLKLRSTLFPEERILCSECGHMITGQKYIQHMKDHKKKINKINWGNIPVINQQKATKQKIREALKKGRQIKTTFVSGGAPGLGKNK
jgi:hypothetical protein